MSTRPKRHGASIFVSYRIADTLPIADRLVAELRRKFGAETVFFDRRTIEPGDIWARNIEKAVKGAVVVLVLIGKKWFTEQDDYGRRRLDIPSDWVRREVETALDKVATVIPVLVDNTSPPKIDAFEYLPSIAALYSRQTAKLRIEDWDKDFLTLVERLADCLELAMQVGIPTHDFDFEPATGGHWVYLGASKYVEGAQFSFRASFFLRTRGSAIKVLSFKGLYAVHGNFAYNGSPRLLIDGEDIPIEGADYYSLHRPFSIAGGKTVRLNYSRDIRPPLMGDEPADCDYGDLEITICYATDTSGSHEVSWHFKFNTGGVLEATKGIKGRKTEKIVR